MTRPTNEQSIFADHLQGAFVEACPGAGKTRTIVARIARIAPTLPPRRGLAVISFTNSAIEEFITRCHHLGLDSSLRHPGFVGTFDAFLRQFFFAPGGIEDVAIRPIVVDSWEALDLNIRLRPPNAFAGKGAALDLFDAEDDRIDPVSIGHAGLRAHVQRHLTAYQTAAARCRRAMRQKGYLSAADVRVDVVRRLQRVDWSTALGRALAARFEEVIVDEGQDCNRLDCQIIRWLRDTGIAVTIVLDPDQAIYGFRHGSPIELWTIAESYNAADRLVLTGNFRSCPAICGVAATLRTRAAADVSLGAAAAITEPVHILAYQGASVPESVGRRFCELMTAAGISRQNGIVLAHARRNALRACGAGAEEDAGNSNAARIARAVGTFWSSSASNRARESALRTVESVILDLTGQIDPGELPGRAAERRGLDPRWLRRSALDLVSRLPPTCADTADARKAWIAALRNGVQRLDITCRAGTSERKYFPNRIDADWHRLLVAGNAPEIGSATIHEAKGKQYQAVCVVIPPDRGEPRRTERLLANWESRRDDEAKRVIYVGITRAEKLGVIAIPAPFNSRLTAVLEAAQANFRVHHI